jgi:hypothetical protein
MNPILSVLPKIEENSAEQQSIAVVYHAGLSRTENWSVIP